MSQVLGTLSLEQDCPVLRAPKTPLLPGLMEKPRETGHTSTQVFTTPRRYSVATIWPSEDKNSKPLHLLTSKHCLLGLAIWTHPVSQLQASMIIP